MTTHTNIGGTWKDVTEIHARVGGSWKEVDEGYTKISGAWQQFYASGPVALDVDYLVIAGGAGGGGAGGGAGGYRTSAGTSGGGASAESSLTLASSTNYTVTVGAGGSAGSDSVQGGTGANSVFSSITSAGGGGGGGSASLAGATGGSGGGGGFPDSGSGTVLGGSGTTNQGYAGGYGQRLANGGGGGGSAVGQNANQRGSNTGGNGGDGVASSITGTSITRAGGGGGVSWSASGATGGAGGGGVGAYSVGTGGSAGTVNTGGGGGGRWGTAFAGGSGIVIIKYPDTETLTVPAGLTSSTATAGGYKVTTFTAGTGNVYFGDAPVFTSDYELLETQVLATSETSVTFSSLGTYAADYKHLQIRWNARSNRGDTDTVFSLKFNGSSGDYQTHGLYGNGSTVASFSNDSTYIYGSSFALASTSPSNAFTGGVMDILDPFNSNKNTTIRSLHGNTGGYNRVFLLSGLWVNTASITTIAFADLYSTIVAGSRFSLYGVKG